MAMTLRDAQNTVAPSALAGRICELLAQSRRYQDQLERIDDELEVLRERIANIGAPRETESVQPDEEERQA
jgi:hypothetical protein